ncbi:MAG: helix-turn-helix domain-containing protein [Solobacterium sp.]|nr:helix-turn-helix domain-containing protein [Solobacterium sp.]
MDAVKTGILIAEARKEKGLTQTQLARQLHITNTAVSKYENGARFPDIAILEELADALDLSVTELVSGEREAADEKHEENMRAILQETGSQERTKRNTKLRRAGILLLIMIPVLILLASVYNRVNPRMRMIRCSEYNGFYELSSPDTEFKVYMRKNGTNEVVSYFPMYQDGNILSTGSYRFIQFAVRKNGELSFISYKESLPGYFEPAEDPGDNVRMMWASEIRANEQEQIVAVDIDHSVYTSLEQYLADGAYEYLLTVCHKSN